MRKIKRSILSTALLMFSSTLFAQTTYDFSSYPITGYSYGNNPTDIACTDVSATSTGYWKVSASVADANVKVLNVGAYTVSGSSSILTGDLTKFPSAATNYSVIAKKITNSTLGKWGFVLRGQSTSKNYPGTASGSYSNLRDGILFQINENNTTSATLTIRKPSSSTSFSNLTNTSTNGTTLTYTANSPIWYKAEASGTNFTFSWSTDSLTWNVAYSGVDATYASGSTQIWSGLGTNTNPIQIQYITYQPVSILPVTLSSFNANASGNGVNLTWQTLKETDNAGFEIERKSETSNFEKIGSVAKASNGSGVSYYSFTDNFPAAGVNYYRLKQFDIDGKYSYSEIVSTKSMLSSKVELYPNPATNVLNVSFQGEKAAFTVSNSLGQIVISKQLNGPDASQINISSLPSGIYIYRVNDTKGTFIKQ